MTIRYQAPSSSSTGGGHVIEDEGTPLTQRANLNFTGAGVTAVDSGGKTVVTITGGASGTVSMVGGGDTIFVQSTDPAGLAQDGDLWIDIS